MKHRSRPAAILLCAALLLPAACAPKEAEATPAPTPAVSAPPTPAPTPEPAPGAFRFTRENFPRLDGSTATAPMGRAAAAALLGEGEEDVADLVGGFSKTTQSYYNLIDGRAEVLLSAEPNQEALDYKAEQDFAWEMEPFANDAFVFLVNAENPVDSLTLEEIRGIYTGRITNWSEVGGEDVEIVPFQRNQGAGSQTLMEKLVMGDVPMMEAPLDWVQGEMGGLMEAVRAFDGSRAAIGYSVYYYAEAMEMAGGLKLLEIDGTAPNPDTIASGAYPLLNPYYVVLPADAPEDGAARAFFNWMLSEEGQALAAGQGYVPVRGGSAARPGGELAGEKMVRWYEGETDELIPLAEGYGPLIPFSGQRTQGPLGWEFQINYRKGLMTADGRVVVDPVFFGAEYIGYYDGRSGRPRPLPLLMLTQVEDLGENEYGWRDGQARHAVADAQGRWCTDFDYTQVTACGDGLALYGDEGISIMDVSGTVLRSWTWAELGFAGEARPVWPSDMAFNWSDGMLPLNEDYNRETKRVTYTFLNTETGETVSLPVGCWGYQCSEGLISCGSNEEGFGYVDKAGNWVIEPRFQYSADFRDGRAAVQTLDGKAQVIDRAGNVLLERGDGMFSCYSDGTGGCWYLECADKGDYRYQPVAAYDGALNPLPFTPEDWEAMNWPVNMGGWLYYKEDGETLLYRAGTALRLPGEMDWGSAAGDLAALRRADGTCAVYALPEGDPVIPGGTYTSIQFTADAATGEPYLLGTLSGGVQVLMDGGGRVLRTAGTPAGWGENGPTGEQMELYGGLIHAVSDDAVRVWDREGNLLYSRAAYPDWAD